MLLHYWEKILVDEYFADVEQMLGANMFCLQSKQILYWLSRLVQCWANVGKQILVYKCRVNVGQMLGANNLVPNTQPMLSQYLLRIQIQQYNFIGSQHHLNIDPTLVANICDCLHPTKIQHCLSTLVKCCSNIGKKNTGR